MPVPFTCPHCGTQTSVDEQYAGQTGPCASCGRPVTIPVPFGAPRKTTGSSLGLVLAIMGGLMFVAVPVIGVLIALLLPAVQAVREVEQRARSVDNLKQIGNALHTMQNENAEQCTVNLKRIALAMHNYHDTYASFPPAVVTDDQGAPLSSWRVALLPFLEQQSLFDQWDPKKSWEAPNNNTLGQTSLSVYRCPGDFAGQPWETNYVMITGVEALGGEPNTSAKMPDVTDGTSHTIMIVEVANSGIGWAEPRDLSFEELEMVLNSASSNGMSSSHPGGVHVALVDGSVHFLEDTIDPETLRGLITLDGQEAWVDF